MHKATLAAIARLRSAWIFLPALFFFGAAYNNCPNIPIMDDYPAILGWLHDFNNAHGWDKGTLLFSQFNEHRLLWSRLVYLLYYTVTGEINFRNLMLLSDLQLLGVAVIGVYFIRRAVCCYKDLTCFIWVMAVFDLNTYSNSTITMYGWQNYGTLFLFMCSMLYFHNGKVIMGAILSAVMIFSSGNGIIGAVIVFVSTWNQYDLKKFGWSFAPLLLIPLYFIGWKPNHYHLDAGKSVMFFICNAGAPFSFDWALPWGLLLLLVLAIVFPWRKAFSHVKVWPIYCILAFALASMLMAAIFRAGDMQYQGSRYLMWPQLIIPVVYMLLIDTVQRRRLLFILTIPVMLMCWSYNCWFGSSMFKVMSSRAENMPYYYPTATIPQAQASAAQACADGIYCIDEWR